VVRALRAVDTATHPDHQGRGVFSTLTLGALDELAHPEAGEGGDVGFIFNTPNRRSRPGYLRMGWRGLGRVPVAVRTGPTAAIRLLGARQPAEKWSQPTDVGVSAAEMLDDTEGVARLLAARPLTDRLSTTRNPAYLRWRYGLDVLHYRALPAGDRVEDGLVLFRLRRRGPALEATICETIGLHGRRRIARLVAQVLRQTGADYAIGTRHTLPVPAGLPVPRQGPELTWREVRPGPPARLGDFDLTLGDIELF
jgi:hypothetical protein